MISTQDILKLETRRKIYNYISENPGLHYREIQRKTKIPDATLKYHLKKLEKNNFITHVKNIRYKNYFIKGEIGRKEKKILSLLTKEVYRNIILGLLLGINQSRKDLIYNMDMDISIETLSFHLKKLMKLDLIEIAPVEDGVIKSVENSNPRIVEYTATTNEKIYRLKDPHLIYISIKNYEEKLKDYPHVYLSLEIINYREKYGYQKKGRYKKPDDPERMPYIHKFFEIFPHPYHA